MHPKKKIISFICLSIVIILITGWIKQKPVSSTIEKNRFWALKTHQDNKYDIVIYGDSRVYRGISPDDLTYDLPGYSAINLGYSSGGMTDQMFGFIEERLDTLKDPIIIIGITPYSLTPAAGLNEHYNQEKDRDRYEIFQKIYFDKYLGFFEAINPWNVYSHIVGKEITSQYFEIFHDNGWVESYIIPPDSSSALAKYTKTFSNNNTEHKVSDRIVQNLFRNVGKWNEKGIKIYGFRFPSTDAMVKLENELSGFDETSFAEGFVESGGIWFSFSNGQFKSYDGSHLYFESAKKISRILRDRMFFKEK